MSRLEFNVEKALNGFVLTISAPNANYMSDMPCGRFVFKSWEELTAFVASLNDKFK